MLQQHQETLLMPSHAGLSAVPTSGLPASSTKIFDISRQRPVES